MSDLIDCQSTVEWMLTDGKTLAEVEEYVERCALDEMEKAGLWMLAWAHQDQGHTTATRQRDARARKQYPKPNKLRSEGAPPRRPPGTGYPPLGSSIKLDTAGISH